MAKLKLVANPTFNAKVGIPVAGGEPVDVVFTLKHKTKTGLEEFISTRHEKTDIESVMEMAEGWDLDDEFNSENVATLLENYCGSALAIYRTYIEQLIQAKQKN